ncbi:3-isopropylmalate dehydratase small subunit [uncultured Tateyamaria sp.]|uniref:3-isopropylmalate dehydratase small subunit n=1 Tax=uncultured Tateyamaria sp. TaxID=455651 RepID=UPI002604CA39|nr:3-isopropylmalate dehydratase small subunit [uncultured Tateyamaria sp.]
MIKTINAPLAFLQKDDISTDEIIPSRFLLTTSVEGLGKGLFHDLRYDSDNKLKEDFVLNKPPFQSGCVLVTGRNFGCGSSREHAAWALKEFGVEAIVSESAATNFDRNAAHNNLPVIKISKENVGLLERLATTEPEVLLASINLGDRKLITATDCQISFSLSRLQEEFLSSPIPDIDRALAQKNEIAKTWSRLAHNIRGRSPSMSGK